MTTQQKRPRVVIAGGGFAGLWAAKALAASNAVDVLVIDRNNYHTFLPLLYQVAAAELEPEQIAYPLRGVFRKLPNVDFRLSTICGFDLERKVVLTSRHEVPYDYLILAMGSNTEFFDVNGADEYSFRLKSLEQAIALRNHIITCFEKAAHASDPASLDQRLTFTVVGGGPTGVEYAGALAELIRTPITKDFPKLNSAQARVVLLEAGDGLLAGFPDKLRKYTFRRLNKMGVDVRLNTAVTKVEPHAVHIKDQPPLATDTVVWSAGIRGNRIAEKAGLPLTFGKRVDVTSTLQLEKHPEVFAVGDLAMPQQGESPMIAPNAVQTGELAAKNILALVNNEPREEYHYFDKGAMATIGRSSAVVRIGTKAVTGIIAWVLWLVVHLMYLIGFRNKLFVIMNWAWDYVLFERAVRLILPREPSWVRHGPPINERTNTPVKSPDDDKTCDTPE